MGLDFSSQISNSKISSENERYLSVKNSTKYSCVNEGNDSYSNRSGGVNNQTTDSSTTTDIWMQLGEEIRLHHLHRF